MNELTHLDLFSGIGGFALAARWAGFRTIGFCEIDGYCQKVLAKNFGATLAATSSGTANGSTNGQETVDAARKVHVHPNLNGKSELSVNDEMAIMCGDIRDLNGADFRGVTLVTGGFPCQPFSVAGKRRGKEDDRHIWPEMLRVIGEARPAWVLGENVTGIVGMELDQVLSDLEGIGYATRAFIIPACGVDAPHRRNRVWIVAQAGERGWGATRGLQGHGQVASTHRREGTHDAPGNAGETSRDVAYAETREDRRLQQSGIQRDIGASCCWPDEREWFAQSGMGRVAYGIPDRVHRLRALGNSIVPQLAYQISKAIADIENKRLH
jgi:DNA (cytosine-5)-methyltransferase 1